MVKRPGRLAALYSIARLAVVLAQDPRSLILNDYALQNRAVPLLTEVDAGWSNAEARLQQTARRLQQTLTTEEDASPIDVQLEHLASQQRLASIQLQQLGLVAHHGLEQAKFAGAPSGMALEQQGSHPNRFLAATQPGAKPLAKQFLALPQTITQLWRQKNPALAAALLEPALYGYSLIVWILAMLFTGMSSVLGFYMSKQLRARLTGTQQLPRPHLPETLQERGPSRLSSYFEYPGVESWVKVPQQTASKTGYLDDESDEETERSLGTANY